jgi:23S rRNA pseudouridine1911/1915/1917 synthase|tara:strand:+ start:3618 stop:4631 length:1014 start_codon:yes stop_codon:yes gene_type:complete
VNRLAESTNKQYNQPMKLLQQQIRIESEFSGSRLDQALHRLLPDFSRSVIQDWIKSNFIQLNRKPCQQKQKVYVGDLIDLDIPFVAKISDLPQKIEFNIIHEDNDFFIIDKPANLVVHPAAGHASGTLVNGLLDIDPTLEQLPRAGIVHRLDKDTTGVMVVARTLQAHASLVDQLQQRLVKREYIAITQGVVTAGRTVETEIARHPVNRKKMAVQIKGKHAITHFQVAEKFSHHTFVKVQLETGRTHQIRVHLAHVHYPLLGDPLYGGRFRLPMGVDAELGTMMRNFGRQALHARYLSFAHPTTKEPCRFEAKIPKDFQRMLDALRASIPDDDSKTG